ncbi:3-isopropylmalate dehydratase large subunit [Sabulicella glaciei]|uniref:3-isopropylmalate dehydratase large subunit n=1 Tax=Sabulicella glaciei TaxID=2984948 RepID=A0ABT3NWQ5_9PROT|nr:3-isopropylmalate dehydratase large subunit [Roseococcus sp. MDT2-1-1]MCW8086598.1 3-isopropylmalate dehydratase large subunit [Roseococcus sp. MDT2-1-1]
MTEPRTMLQKIWDDHLVLEEDGRSLLLVARHLAHDGSFQAFGMLEKRGLTLRCPYRTFATPDHGVPTLSHRLDDIEDAQQRRVVDALHRNAERHGFTVFGLEDDRQGIIHVVGPEQGITQPGLLMVCGDSHTSTHGALGALAFGIGTSEVAHVLATQTIWRRRPKSMRVIVEGERPAGVTAKDVILAIIARIGANGAAQHVIEYAGSTIRAMSVEERLTVCNMSIEAGARAGMVAPDETAFAYLKGRPFAPLERDWEAAVAHWRGLPSDPGARFDAEITLDAALLAPMVTWGNSPEDALPVTGRVPDPGHSTSGAQRDAVAETLAYMGLVPGQAVTDIAVDQVFIGSCTNARLSDLREAAAVARLGRARVPAMVSPGSTLVKHQAEAEGLDRVFREAGFEWRESGCSMCVGMNGDLVDAGKRCASTSNRNFRGRQGRGSRTHLMSPAMAAAAALHGRITDVRELVAGGA